MIGGLSFILSKGLLGARGCLESILLKAAFTCLKMNSFRAIWINIKPTIVIFTKTYPGPGLGSGLVLVLAQVMQQVVVLVLDQVLDQDPILDLKLILSMS